MKRFRFNNHVIVTRALTKMIPSMFAILTSLVWLIWEFLEGQRRLQVQKRSVLLERARRQRLCQYRRRRRRVVALFLFAATKKLRNRPRSTSNRPLQQRKYPGRGAAPGCLEANGNSLSTKQV